MNLQNTENSEYANWIAELKSKIQSTQLRAAVNVNKELLNLYWELGKSISLKISESNWGTSVVEQLSKDLKKSLLRKVFKLEMIDYYLLILMLCIVNSIFDKIYLI